MTRILPRQGLLLALIGAAAGSLGAPAFAQVDPNRMVDTFERLGGACGTLSARA